MLSGALLPACECLSVLGPAYVKYGLFGRLTYETDDLAAQVLCLWMNSSIQVEFKLAHSMLPHVIYNVSLAEQLCVLFVPDLFITRLLVQFLDL